MVSAKKDADRMAAGVGSGRGGSQAFVLPGWGGTGLILLNGQLKSKKGKSFDT